MFKRILVPISVEHFPEMAIKRAGDLMHRTNAKVFLVYIVEENIFEEVKKRAIHIMSPSIMEALEHDMIDHYRKEADICFNMAQQLIKGRIEDTMIIRALYSDGIIKAIKSFGCDLVIMEHIHGVLIKYRIIHNSPVDLWIERYARDLKKIALFASNLAPNEKTPSIAKEIENIFGQRIIKYFINDPHGERWSEERIKLLIGKCTILEGNYDTEIYQIVDEIGIDLAIIGRIKGRGLFRDRGEFAKRMKCNVLLTY